MAIVGVRFLVKAATVAAIAINAATILNPSEVWANDRNLRLQRDCAYCVELHRRCKGGNRVHCSSSKFLVVAA